MNENLFKAIETMFHMTDEQPYGENIKKIIKKKDWYLKYHWTQKNQEKFTEWMAEYLKKNWEGIVDFKPTTKKLREKIATDFVLSYGAVVRPLNIDDFTSVVSWEQLEEIMSKQEIDDFMEWMNGQTMPLYGVYRSDLSRYLAHYLKTNNTIIKNDE